MNGHYVRSRAQWLHEGEKPTKFFCSLEKGNYINKTLKCLRKNDGTYINDQKEILTQFQKYYKKLFKACDGQPENLNLEDIFLSTKFNKLSHVQAKSIEGELKLDELNVVLKKHET